MLNSINNLYEKKQAGRVRNKYRTKKLLIIRSKKLDVGECVFFQGHTILTCYVENGIFAVPWKEKIDQEIKYVHRARLDIEEKGDSEYYLVLNI